MKLFSDKRSSSLEYRVLLLVPTRKDAEVTAELLRQSRLRSVACESIHHLTREIRAGAAAVLMTEEAIAVQGVIELLDVLKSQAEWSDLPIVVQLRGGTQSPRAEQVLGALTNVTLLERPAPLRSVLSAVQAAVRARDRQYQIRSQIETIQRAESRARELQLQLEAAVDASELGTFYCELPLSRLVWNDRCKAHFWVSPDADVDIELFYSRLHPDDRERTRQTVEACVNHGVLFDTEYRTVSPDGRIRWLRASGRTTFDAQQRPLRFDGTTQDITSRKQIEEERNTLLGSERAARLEAERANHLKDEFLATLSHELRTPLNAIFGWTQLLKESLTEVETVEEGIGAIERNVRVQTQLIEDLLDMSRIISGKVRLEVLPIDLRAVIAAAVETVLPAAQAKGIEIQTAVSSAAPITGDPGRLQQVVWNLLANAVKFTSSGGVVRIEIETTEDRVDVRVIDSGEGISPVFLPRLFERFSQADGSTSRRHGGLGLGLSIVKNLTEMHGGRVWADSEGEGKGSTFHVSLPSRLNISPEPIPPATKPTLPASADPPAKPALVGTRVLIVDDEADAREILRRLVSRCGGVTAVAASVPDALGQVPEFQPDVILSDIGMPGVDGHEFVRELRSKGIETPAIALTAFARAEDRDRALRAGFQAHIAKPIEPAELLGVVGRVLSRSGVNVAPISPAAG